MQLSYCSRFSPFEHCSEKNMGFCNQEDLGLNSTSLYILCGPEQFTYYFLLLLFHSKIEIIFYTLRRSNKIFSVNCKKFKVMGVTQIEEKDGRM